MAIDEDEVNRLEKEAVLALGLRIGFGRVMYFAEECWREYEVEKGLSGSEHTRGPCAAFMVSCDHNGLEGHECDWCCGAGRVTERVAQAMKALSTERENIEDNVDTSKHV